MTEKEIIQKIYEAIKLVDCMQYNPLVDFNYLRAKGAYNVIKNQVEHIEAENAELRARLEEAVELPRIIHPNKSEWHIRYQYKSGIIDSEIKFSEEAAEARLKEIKEEI